VGFKHSPPHGASIFSVASTDLGWRNARRLGTTDIREPSVLMYDKDGNLNSPEWVAPLDGFPAPPTIFGLTMHADDDLGLWIQHVWVWKLNPNGVFEDVNPNVTCP